MMVATTRMVRSGENATFISAGTKMSEVLTVRDYQKVEKIIRYLEENNYITLHLTEELTRKSASTVRRYLKILVDIGYVKVGGNTSNIKYVL